MLRSELVAKLATENPHLFHGDVERVVDTVLEEITKALARVERVKEIKKKVASKLDEVFEIFDLTFTSRKLDRDLN